MATPPIPPAVLTIRLCSTDSGPVVAVTGVDVGDYYFSPATLELASRIANEAERAWMGGSVTSESFNAV